MITAFSGYTKDELMEAMRPRLIAAHNFGPPLAEGVEMCLDCGVVLLADDTLIGHRGMRAEDDCAVGIYSKYGFVLKDGGCFEEA